MPSLKALVALLLVALPALRTVGGASSKWINSVAASDGMVMARHAVDFNHTAITVKTKGPWIAYVEKVEMCEDNEMDKSWGYAQWNLRISHWNPHRPRDPQILNGNGSLINATISDDKWFRVTLAVRSNNMWKENAFVIKAPYGGCSFVRNTVPNMWRTFSGKDPKDGPCFVGEGVYVWKDLPITWDVPKVPVMPYGFYRGVVHGGLHGREHLKPGLCLKGEVHLVPRV